MRLLSSTVVFIALAICIIGIGGIVNIKSFTGMKDNIT